MSIVKREEVGYDLDIQVNRSGSARQFSTDSIDYRQQASFSSE